MGQHLHRSGVLAAVGYNDVCVALAGFHKSLVHGLDGGQVLIDDAVQTAAPLLHIPHQTAQDALVGVGVHIDLIVEQGAQLRLQTPVTIPIILGFILMMTVFEDPNSPIAFWGSIIPFTSPIVMIARIPSHIPSWQIILSLVVLYASVAVMIWIAARIYRVGILMHGKRPSFKELLSWIRQ